MTDERPPVRAALDERDVPAHPERRDVRADEVLAGGKAAVDIRRGSLKRAAAAMGFHRRMLAASRMRMAQLSRPGRLATVQSPEFQRLGVIGDWANPYLTMTKAAEAQIAREIHKFLRSDALYQGVKPVLWSVVEKTAMKIYE